MRHEDIKTIDDWVQWCDENRRKHRVMTVGEYRAWCAGGDEISHPGSSNAFPGGLTITLGHAIIGRVIDRPAAEG